MFQEIEPNQETEETAVEAKEKNMAKIKKLIQ
jgi:hypothetical protein